MAEERRLVTVLFADVAGSTGLGEALDPEDVRSLLARFAAIAKEVVARYGGTLEKFIGDAAMAVFGLPQAHDDDPKRALFAALEIRDRVRTEPSLGEWLPIRIGVNTGEVIAARDPSGGDFLVTGDAVTVAARLQQVADPWTILCSERTAHAAGSIFAFGPATDIDVRGRSQRVRAQAVVGRGEPAPLHRTPLVGRDGDLAQLELAARRAFAERRPYLVCLIAPAGTGKTRLVEEFLGRRAQIVPLPTVAVAQCLPYGQQLTYWPLRALLFRLSAVPEDASPHALRDALQTWLQAAGVNPPDRTAELLMATVGLTELQAVDRDALFAAWRTAIEAAARQRPLVLVFEDLHWASDSLLDLFEFVMQPWGDCSALMIALTRPELLDRRPAWGGGRRNYIAIALEPLDAAAVTLLVEHLVGPVSPEIISRVIARAEGNPFYVEEIIRTLRDRVPSVQDQAAVERALSTLPDTVQATVLARLDLLSPPERRVLQIGSVFGRAFRREGIAALAPDIHNDLNRSLDGLLNKDIIRPSDTDQISFRHILIQEVAYQTLPRNERARLHAAAGRWFEAQARGQEESFAELIAHHYREAAMVSGPLAQDSPSMQEARSRAASWLARAAEAARAGAADVEAASHLRNAIDLAARGELPDLYEHLGQVTWGDAGADAFRTALQLCREARRPIEQELRVLGNLLMLYLRWGGTIGTRPSVEDVARLRAEGQDLLERAGEGEAAATFLIADSFFPFWSNARGEVTAEEMTLANARARRGLDIATRLEDHRLRSAALDSLGGRAWIQGTWRDAREANQQRLAFQDRLDLNERLDAFSMIVHASNLLGDLDEADRVSAEGLAIVQPGQVPASVLHLAAERLYALVLLGKWDDATSLGDRAQLLRSESRLRSTLFATPAFLAALDVARARRDPRRVARLRDTLTDIFASVTLSPVWLSPAPYLAIDLPALERNVIRDTASARAQRVQFVERALSLCCDHSYPVSADAARWFVEFAVTHELRALEGQARRALGLAFQDPAPLNQALQTFETIGAIPCAARARCERAVLTGDAGEFARGAQVLERLGDLDHLERLERARKA